MSAINHDLKDEKTPDKLRIVFFVPWITKGRGGTENVGHMMANAMVERGHHVDIFTFDDKKEPSLWPLRAEVNLHYLDTGTDAAADSRMLFAAAQRNPDLIVGLHMNRAMLRYVRCARKLGVPLVLSEHIDPRFPVKIGTFTREERLTAFHGADRIHLLTSAFRGVLPKHLQDKATVVPNTVPPASLRSTGRRKTEKTIVTVARLVPRKNVGRLITEFSLLARDFPEWKLQIIGDGPERKALEAQCQRLELLNSVEFTGEVADPYPFLARAHIFVLASLFEGFPMSSLEALAHGLPVVGYRIRSGVNEQVADGENGFLVESSEEGSLATALRELLNNPEQAKQMGEASLRRYKMLYSNSTVFAAWEKLFVETARSSHSANAASLPPLLDGLVEQQVFGTSRV